MRYLLIDSNNVVINVCEWDGDTKTWSPPVGFTAVQNDTADIGDVDIDGVFVKPDPLPPVIVSDPVKDVIVLLVQKGVISQTEADGIGKALSNEDIKLGQIR